MNHCIKKSIFTLALLTACLTTFNVHCAQNQAPKWYETNEWYEQDLGAKCGEANPIHLAITLSECFSHDPYDIAAFDKAITFWLNRGGDINQTFMMGDLVSLVFNEKELAQYPEQLKTKSVTLLMAFIGAHTIVETLLKHKAKTIVNNESLLNFWAEQYIDMKHKDTNNKMHGCSGCIDIAYQWQHDALRALFTASDKQQQSQFLQKYPEFKALIDENKK